MGNPAEETYCHPNKISVGRRLALSTCPAVLRSEQLPDLTPGNSEGESGWFGARDGAIGSHLQPAATYLLPATGAASLSSSIVLDSIASGSSHNFMPSCRVILSASSTLNSLKPSSPSL